MTGGVEESQPADGTVFIRPLDHPVVPGRSVGALYIQPLTSDEWTDLGWTSTDGLSYTRDSDETEIRSWADANLTTTLTTSFKTVTMAFETMGTGFWDTLRVLCGHLQRWADPVRAERLRRMHRAYRRRRS